MTLAIKFGDSQKEGSISGVLFFDAVTEFSRIKSGKVTEHPIESGALITDHFISDNPTYEIKGIFSHVDFSPTPSMTLVDGDLAINQNHPPSPSYIDGGSVVDRFLPTSVGQFLSLGVRGVHIDSSPRTNFNREIEDLVYQLVNGVRWSNERGRWELNTTTAVLYEVENNTAINPIGDLVLTSFKVDEDADSGEALVVSMQLVQVMFVTSQDAEAPKVNTKTSDGRKQTSTKDKGSQGKGELSAPEKERITVLGVGRSKFGGGL